MLNSFNRRFPVALVYILFGVPFIGLGLIDSFINSYLFFYYEVEIGHPIFIIAMTFYIVEVIILLFQPFLGYISDRNYGFTRKLGRRFPWILGSGFLTASMLVVLFMMPMYIPSTYGFLILIVYLIFSFSFTTFTISLFASLLTRFRNPKERVLLAMISQTLSGSSAFITLFFTPFFIKYGLPSSYQSTAIIIAVLFIACLMIGFIGIFEEQEVIDSYFNPNNVAPEGFLNNYAVRYRIFRNKNFLLLSTQFMIIAIFNYLFNNEMIYYIYYVLGLSATFQSIIYTGYIIWLILGVLGGFILSWFLGHLKTYIISGFLMSLSLIIATFMNEFALTVLFINAVGFGYGLNIISMIPLIGDTFDDNSHTHRMRSDGFAYGTLLMFSSLGTIISPFFSSIMRSMTGFIPGSSTQTPMALWGIKILFTLIPGILVLIGIIIFTFTYDLKPERTEIIRMELNELQI